MRMEVKVAFVIVLGVTLASSIWWYSVRRAEDELPSIPLSLDASKTAPADNLILAQDSADTSAERARPHDVQRDATASHAHPGSLDRPIRGKTSRDIATIPHRQPTPPANSDAPDSALPRPQDSPADQAAQPGDDLVEQTLTKLESARSAAEEKLVPIDTDPGRPTEPRKTTDEVPGANPSTPLAANTSRYTVQPGDRLIDIARLYYDDGDLWRIIKQANPGLDENRIKIGQVLIVPDKNSALRLAAENAPRPAHASNSDSGARIYVVAPGDTLIGIARNVLLNSDRWREVYELNRDQLSTPDRITVGMKLKLPARSGDGPEHG